MHKIESNRYSNMYTIVIINCFSHEIINGNFLYFKKEIYFIRV